MSDSARGSSVDETPTRPGCEPGSVLQGSFGPADVGASLSRYVVLEELGAGGMGRVLRAYDPKLQREVALKEVRRDVLDDEATARLVAEARAMAKLSHPNVVAVYDVEEQGSGEVVVAMEYVAGTTLGRWLGEEDRSWRDIVRRFIDAGRGLVAAHGAELLHRDFKPANVLVTADGAVKVTDFGLAKASGSDASRSASIEAEPAERNLTEAGTVMGTPRYMAPEQHRGEALTAAVDQYAFCVALWEALCGEPPFSGKTMAAAKHAGPPKWPELSTPRPIVDAIVRGLAPDPRDRWPSMDALLQALAWDPSARRKHVLVGLGGVGVLAMAGVSYQAWADARAKRCSGAEQKLAGTWDDARREEIRGAVLGVGVSYAPAVWTRTEAALDAYAEDWTAMHTEACEATTVRGEQSAEVMDLRMTCLHRAQVELHAATEVLADADADALQHAHELVGDLAPLQHCADVESLQAGTIPPRPDEAEAVEAARVLLAQAKAELKAGHYPRARAEVDRAAELLADVSYAPVNIELARRQGQVHAEFGEYAEAEAAYTRALEQAMHTGDLEGMQASAMALLLVVGNGLRRMDEALMRYRALALGLRQDDVSAHEGARNNIANVLAAQGKYEEAEAEHRRALASYQQALGPNHPYVAQSRSNLASVLYFQGKYEEAETEHRRALAVREQALGPDHPDVARSRNNLAIVLAVQGKYQEAEAQFRRALAQREQALGPDHPDVAQSRGNLAILLHDQGEYEEAEAEYRRALALAEQALGPDHLDVAISRSSLADVLCDQSKYEEALPLAEQAWARRKLADKPPERRANTAFVLARILWSVDGPGRDRPRAHRLARDALASYQEAGDGQKVKVVEVQQWLQDHPLR